MFDHRYSIFGPQPTVHTAKSALRLAPTGKDDVVLNALLETPLEKQPRRSPLEWLGAMGFHIGIIAALIIIPLFTTATIHMTEYEDTTLIAPPPPAPPPPPPPAGGAPAASHVTHIKPKLKYTLPKFNAPIEPVTPKAAPASSQNVAQGAPNLGGVPGGVAGGVPGGVFGGVVGGVTGGTGPSAPTPPPAAARPVKPTPKVVRVGGNIRAPRQTYSVAPVYPPLARQTRVWGTVVVDALIDEHGNVVQARVVSGPPLLIEAALKAVLQWKYQPTTLNGQPISVEMQVQVHFNLDSGN
jgi:periplasmic protein TonB